LYRGSFSISKPHDVGADGNASATWERGLHVSMIWICGDRVQKCEPHCSRFLTWIVRTTVGLVDDVTVVARTVVVRTTVIVRSVPTAAMVSATPIVGPPVRAPADVAPNRHSGGSHCPRFLGRRVHYRRRHDRLLFRFFSPPTVVLSLSLITPYLSNHHDHCHRQADNRRRSHHGLHPRHPRRPSQSRRRIDC